MLAYATRLRGSRTGARGDPAGLLLLPALPLLRATRGHLRLGLGKGHVCSSCHPDTQQRTSIHTELLVAQAVEQPGTMRTHRHLEAIRSLYIKTLLACTSFYAHPRCTVNPRAPTRVCCRCRYSPAPLRWWSRSRYCSPKPCGLTTVGKQT